MSRNTMFSPRQAAIGDAHLRIETLGPLRVFAGERELALGSPKQRAVFAILALSTNSVVSRDDMIDHLWGESPPDTAVGSLYTYVCGLRRLLVGMGATLTSSGTGYALQLDPGRLDVRVVERLAARARNSRDRQDPVSAVAALDEALAFWRPGCALSGLPGPFAAEYRSWASDLQLRLLLERAELLLELKLPATAADQLRARLPANPYDERLRALLMTALHQSGRTADALAQYQDLRKLLAEELGIDPSAQVRTLYSSILADTGRTRTTLTRRAAPAVAAAPVRPARLPRGAGDFIGRADAVRQLLAAARTTDLVTDLEDVRRRLDALEIPDDELYSVRSVLSWSYARLDAASAAVRQLQRGLGLLDRLGDDADVTELLRALDADPPPGPVRDSARFAG